VSFRYASVRESGVEWLGLIPDHWEVHRIKASVKSCRNGIWGDEPDGGGDDIICVRVADFDRNRSIVSISEPTFRKVIEKEYVGRQLTRGDLLLEKSGGGEKQPVGAVVMYDHSEVAVCSNFVARVQLKNGMDPRYWTYVHNAAYSVRLTLGSINQTSGIQNLDSGRYFEERAPFPSTAEQFAIGVFLDRETKKIDALVEEQRRLIKLLKEKRQAVITHAVTKGLNATVPLKGSGVKWLGDIPAHWSVRRIGSVSTKITNGYVGPTRDILVDKGVRYLQSLHVKRNKITFDTPYFVRKDWSDAHPKSILEEGNVLIVQTGDIGQVAVVTEEFTGCNCHALIIVAPLSGQLDGRWLSWVLNGEFGLHSLLSIQTGALHPHLNCGNVKDLLVPLPPLDEQVRIIASIEAQIENFTALTKQAEALIVLLKERRAALIYAAVTGKMDLRNLSDIQAKAA
jgi:type I restriction enzyme S subunit